MGGSCYEFGVKLLSIREHSEHEIRTKMNKKDFSEEEMETTIDKLKELGFQSNKRFADTFVRSRYNQGKGPVKIRGELNQRKVNSFDLDGYDWYQLARDVYEKKYNTVFGGDYKEKAKRIRFLQSRGFDSEQVGYAMEVHSD